MKIATITRWEFKQTLSSKQFLALTIILPVVIGLAIFVGVQAGGDPVEMTGPPPPMILGLFLAFILFLGAFMSGAMTLYGIAKEKQTRSVEMMLSSVSAWELMAGKLLGLGLAGLVQVTLWALLAFAAASSLFPVSIAGIPPLQVVAYALYFILGYLFIASIYGSIGAAIKDVHSGGLASIVGIVPAMPLMLSAVLIQNPSALWVRIAGFIPPFTPGVMLIRIGATPVLTEGAQTVPAWEIVLSLLSLSIGTYFMMRFASRVFQVGILMTGKSASLRELWRWGRRGLSG